MTFTVEAQGGKQAMTTARDAIAEALIDFYHEGVLCPTPFMATDDVFKKLLSAPDSVRQELAALLNPGTDCVTISRAELEAYRAAAQALVPFRTGDWGAETAWIVEGAAACATREEGIRAAARFSRLRAEADKALAAIHAAGIQIEGG